MLEEPENRQLLDGFRRAESATLTEVYETLAPELARFLGRGFSLGNGGRFPGYRSPFDLENALQEVFLRLFSENARRHYDGIRPFRAYAYTVGKNYVVDEIRRGHRRPSFETELRDDDTPTPDRAQSVAEERELERLLRDFVESCPSELRELAVARFFDSKTQNEAASSLGLSRIQVRRREAKLRRDLLHYLKSHGYLEHVDVRLSEALTTLAVLLATTGAFASPATADAHQDGHDQQPQSVQL